MSIIADINTAVMDAYKKTGDYPTKIHITDSAYYKLLQDDAKYMGQWTVSPPPQDTIMGVECQRWRDGMLGDREFALDYQDDLKNAYAFGYVVRDKEIKKTEIKYLHVERI